MTSSSPSSPKASAGGGATRCRTQCSTGVCLVIVATIVVLGYSSYIEMKSLGSIPLRASLVDCRPVPVITNDSSQQPAVSNPSGQLSSDSGGGSTELAKRHSLGFFDNIADARWQQIRNYTLNAPQYMHPRAKHTGFEKPSMWYLNNLNPSFNCQHQQRVGGLGDGPKFVCDPVSTRFFLCKGLESEAKC